MFTWKCANPIKDWNWKLKLLFIRSMFIVYFVVLGQNYSTRIETLFYVFFPNLNWILKLDRSSDIFRKMCFLDNYNILHIHHNFIIHHNSFITEKEEKNIESKEKVRVKISRSLNQWTRDKVDTAIDVMIFLIKDYVVLESHTLSNHTTHNNILFRT